MTHTPEPWALRDARSIFERQDGTPARYIVEVRRDGYKSLIAGSGFEPAIKHGGTHAANARRIVACVNACAGLSTEQLEAMTNAGTLADAYDACSAIVEAIGFATLDDDEAFGDVPSDDLFTAVSEARESALRACGWARPTC